MIICRAGYNTVNEVLITGAKALIIPEYHMSGEQERRAKNIPSDNITVKTEDDILGNDPDPIILELLERKKKPVLFTADKYDAGQKMIQEMEALSRNMFGH
jgi:UDP-N-acetylglucosamine:LPS N-acetylglucosamine transferase